MTSKPPTRARRIHLWHVAFLYLILIGVLAWRMRPEPESELEALRAPRLERLTHYLLKAPPETVKPILMSVVLIPDDRLTLVDAWLQRTPELQLRELTVQNSAMLKNAGSLRDILLLGWLGQPRLYPLNEAHLMITAAGDRLDDNMRLFALESLAARARHTGDLETVRIILERASELPTATWQTVSAYLQAARASGQHAAALLSVTRWIARHPEEKNTAQLADARQVQATLLLRSNRAEEALAHQISALEDAPAGGPLPAATLDLALVSARAAGQAIKLVPWLERQLATFPEHATSPQKWLSETDFDPDYCHWLSEWAAIADRELPPARGFEACLRLAATGERSALARVCALAGPAKRLPEAQAFLTQALAQPALRSTVLDLAQTDLLGQRVVAEALRRAPQDRDLHFAATLAAAAQVQPGTAVTLWQSYLHRFPTDLTACRRLIQSHLHARQPQLALRVYQSLDPKTLTEEDRHQRSLLSQM